MATHSIDSLEVLLGQAGPSLEGRAVASFLGAVDEHSVAQLDGVRVTAGVVVGLRSNAETEAAWFAHEVVEALTL